MAENTLHTKTPCPGTGSIAPLVEADQSLALTVEGVGAVFAVFQKWGHIDGAPWVKIGSPVTVSGTVIYDEENEVDVFVTDTHTFTTLATELYVELLDITPGANFTCVQTDVPPN